VAAPLLTVGVPIELPEAKGQQLQSNKEPLAVSVNKAGKVFIQDAEVPLNEVANKLKALAKNGFEEQIFVRGDKGVEYGTMMRVFGRIKASGFTKVSLVTEQES
jgi:biopolymer transport protein TolR